ncbi:MAG: M23 family metallopeptidase [Alphaproteobacteria bacterium]|nr:M23 family metallopeptidase [Alphaproteobacteria bacterium]
MIEQGRAFHEVAAGETVYRISHEYGVEMDRLIAENRLEEPFTLAIGQRLRLPVTQTHTVARGDTLFSISQDNGVTVASVSALNGIGAPYTIFVGQELQIPPTRGAPASAVPGTASGGTGGAVPGQLPPVPRADGSGLIWPLEGRIISSFGPKRDGRRNDGINIAAPRGSPVRAAESGVVAYADSTIRGLGNLLLIKHQGGLITAYAHNEAQLVARGDVVAKGQVIARVGSTGGVASPQLHFEIRRSGNAVDPAAFIAGQ